MFCKRAGPAPRVSRATYKFLKWKNGTATKNNVESPPDTRFQKKIFSGLISAYSTTLSIFEMILCAVVEKFLRTKSSNYHKNELHQGFLLYNYHDFVGGRSPGPYPSSQGF